MTTTECIFLAAGFIFCVLMLADMGLNPTDKQVQSHVLPLTQREQALGVELSLEGLYFDGQRFLLGWKTNNTKPKSPALVQYTQLQ